MFFAFKYSITSSRVIFKSGRSRRPRFTGIAERPALPDPRRIRINAVSKRSSFVWASRIIVFSPNLFASLEKALWRKKRAAASIPIPLFRARSDTLPGGIFSILHSIPLPLQNSRTNSASPLLSSAGRIPCSTWRQKSASLPISPLSLRASNAVSRAIESAPPETAIKKTVPAGQSFMQEETLFSN